MYFEFIGGVQEEFVGRICIDFTIIDCDNWRATMGNVFPAFAIVLHLVDYGEDDKILIDDLFKGLYLYGAKQTNFLMKITRIYTKNCCLI